MSNCVVIFPIHRTLNELELSFLENGLDKTKEHKQIIIAPEGLIIDQSFGQLEVLEIKRFAKHCFENINGYNKLLISKDFYSEFILFDYMLIHQPDVYLFKPELDYWCDKNYDYIGAPWFRPDKLNKGSILSFIEKTKQSFKLNKLYSSRHNKVGNGGLSLRNIKTALKVLSITPPKLLNQYLNSEGCIFNEDIFWSLEAPIILKEYKIPGWEEALHFAIEFKPSIAYKYLNQNLPFGCHAPLKHEPEFWREYIPELK